MTRTHKLLGAAAAVLMMVAVSTAPAKAQFAGGGDDMMTQMAPMLNMMKAKMGKKRFGTLMQTMGPMMSKMMDGSGGGFGSLGGLGGGSLGGGSLGGLELPALRLVPTTSLKIRVLLLVAVLLVTGIWGLAIEVTQVLRDDLKRRVMR